MDNAAPRGPADRGPVDRGPADSGAEPSSRDTRWLRRVVVVVGLVLLVLVLAGVAIYAAAFIMLAPMMQ